jgi:hypothetical protein
LSRVRKINSALDSIQSASSIKADLEKSVSETEKKLIFHVDKKDFVSTMSDAERELNKKTMGAFDKLAANLSALKPYGVMIASIAQAKDEAGIEKAIENAILPAGSSSIKKHSVFNISIQSYLGFNAGWYRAPGDYKKNTAANDAWITAPIGLQLSKGRIFKKHPSLTSSLGLFAGVLDLGAVVNYKLNQQGQPESNDLQISFQQVVSPSAYLVAGLGRLPISVGFGWQWSGALTQNVIQVGRIFFAVDIPFFTLTNREDKSSSH